MIVSVSSYSFKTWMDQGHTILEAVDQAHDMAFLAMEFVQIPGNTFDERKVMAHEVKKRLDSYGMTTTAYTIGADMFTEGAAFDAQFDNLKQQLEIAKILGAPLMRHDATFQKPGIGKAGRSFDRMLPLMVKNIKTVTEYARTMGIKTCVENHGYTVQDAERLERLYNAVDDDNFGLLVDMGNFLCVDDDPVHAVSRLAPYAIHVHAKDMIVYSGEAHHPGEGCMTTRGGNFLRGTIIGQGSVPVKQCLHILKLADYPGALGLEFEGCEEALSSIRRGYNNLKRYLQELNIEA